MAFYLRTGIFPESVFGKIGAGWDPDLRKKAPQRFKKHAELRAPRPQIITRERELRWSSDCAYLLRAWERHGADALQASRSERAAPLNRRLEHMKSYCCLPSPHGVTKWTVQRRDREEYPYSLDRPDVIVHLLRGRARHRLWRESRCGILRVVSRLPARSIVV